MSAETLPERRTVLASLGALHRPRDRNRGIAWPADPLTRWVVRLALATPLVLVAAVLAMDRTGLVTPNTGLAVRAGGEVWNRADPGWVAALYPPITTVVAAITPFGAVGLSFVGALAAGLLLQRVIEGMRMRGYSIARTVVFTVALAVNPLFVYLATEDLASFVGLACFGLGMADLVRFTAHRDTQGGFRAGILFMLAALSDPSGAVLVLVAALTAPLLTAGRERAPGARFANTLVVLFPTLSAFAGVAVLEVVFRGDPGAVLHDLVRIGVVRPGLVAQVFTTSIGWLWLATMAGAWGIALLTGRPGAVPVLLLLFATIVGGYVVGAVPASAAGLVYLVMMLTVVAMLPAATTPLRTVAVNGVGLLMLAVAWTTAFDRPVVLQWLQLVVGRLLQH